MKKLRTLPTNLVMNNLVHFNACECSKALPENTKYYDLVEVEREDGSRVEKLVEQEYPITPEYVKSFEQSADYRLDVDGAIANSHSRKNLGDVSQVQSIYNMDTAEIEALGKKLLKASELLKKNKPAQAQAVKDGNNNGNESTKQ